MYPRLFHFAFIIVYNNIGLKFSVFVICLFRIVRSGFFNSLRYFDKLFIHSNSVLQIAGKITCLCLKYFFIQIIEIISVKQCIDCRRSFTFFIGIKIRNQCICRLRFIFCKIRLVIQGGKQFLSCFIIGRIVFVCDFILSVFSEKCIKFLIINIFI